MSLTKSNYDTLIPEPDRRKIRDYIQNMRGYDRIEQNLDDKTLIVRMVKHATGREKEQLKEHLGKYGILVRNEKLIKAPAPIKVEEESMVSPLVKKAVTGTASVVGGFADGVKESSPVLKKVASGTGAVIGATVGGLAGGLAGGVVKGAKTAYNKITSPKYIGTAKEKYEQRLRDIQIKYHEEQLEEMKEQQRLASAQPNNSSQPAATQTPTQDPPTAGGNQTQTQTQRHVHPPVSQEIHDLFAGFN